MVTDVRRTSPRTAGVPMAFLGCALRRENRIIVHVLAYTALGTLIGLAVTSIAFWATGWWNEEEMLTLAVGVGVVAAVTISVPLGWWHTARRALARDQGRALSPPDPDAAFEDSQ